MAIKIIHNAQTGETFQEEFDFTPENPRLSEIPMRQQEILEALRQTDYKTLKFIEGQITEEAFELIKAERQLLRNEFNELEEELEALKSA